MRTNGTILYCTTRAGVERGLLFPGFLARVCLGFLFIALNSGSKRSAEKKNDVYLPLRTLRFSVTLPLRWWCFFFRGYFEEAVKSTLLLRRQELGQLFSTLAHALLAKMTS